MLRSALIVLVAVLAIAGGVLHASETQRSVAEENFHEAQTAKDMAVQLLQRDAIFQRYLRRGDQADLHDFMAGDPDLDRELAQARRLSSDSRAELREVSIQQRAESRWEALAEQAMQARDAGRPEPPAHAAAREAALEQFVDASDRYQRVLDGMRREELAAAALVPVRTIFILASLFGLIGGVSAYRRRRAALSARDAEDREHTREADYA